jgi:hypothetical protein
MGVRKAQDAPIAIAINKVSADTPRCCARPTAMGAMRTVAAALLMMSVSSMVPINNIATTATIPPTGWMSLPMSNTAKPVVMKMRSRLASGLNIVSSL